MVKTDTLLGRGGSTVNIYLKDKNTMIGDSAIGYVTFPDHLRIKVSMYNDGRKRKKFKYDDYIFSNEMATAIDSWVEYKPRKTKPRQSKLRFYKTMIVNPNFYGKITIVP